jgi:CubicO group peptidase (beta-lactamase class C family)
LIVRRLLLLLAGVCLVYTVSAQTPALPGGDYRGQLGSLHVRLHLGTGPDGTLIGTLDSPDQGANGLPCADFRLQGSALSFAVPTVHGTWQGTIENGGANLTGTWTQSRTQPLNFSRDSFVPADKPSALDGVWLGVLKVEGEESLRVQYTFRSDRDGREYCAADSPDQSAWGIECGEVSWSPPELGFDVPAIKGRYSGKLSGDGRELVGVWTQGSPASLTLTRQTKPLLPPPPPKISYSPAMAPVAASQMQAVLSQDFAAALESGALSPALGTGVTIGVVRNGVARVFAWGAARADSIFEIGSITKTFTGLLLAQMIEQKRVTLDEPVRALLPPGTVAKPAGGAEITLLDLVTQHSGLPRLPDNMMPADRRNPYADYRALSLYQFLGKHGVEKPANAGFLYSNLGVGMLGQALADRAGTTYPRLLAEEVTVPLRLEDTVVSLAPQQEARFIAGHAVDGRAARGWDFDALAGAGALHSTAADMLAYLEAQLHPGQWPAGGRGAAATLAAALALSQVLRADAEQGTRIAFAWFYQEKRHEYWHNGGTGGYSSYAFFNPQGNYAGIVLLNRGPGPGELADLLGQHLSQRLAGEPAITVGD